MIHVADFGKVNLVPSVGAIGRGCVSVINVFDAVSERIDGSGELPGENVMRFERIRIANNSGIGPIRRCVTRSWRAVGTDEAISATHFPVIIVDIAMMLDARKQ